MSSSQRRKNRIETLKSEEKKEKLKNGRGEQTSKQHKSIISGLITKLLTI